MRRGFTLHELLVVLAIITVLLAFLGGAVVEVPVTLALGWTKYLWRVVPKLKPDPWTAGTAIVCLVGMIVGAHLFLRWLHRATATRPVAPRWPLRHTLRCVGLVVLTFVAGIAVVGMIHQTSWLVRSPEPLFDTGRAGPRGHSANNLKQIGVAVHSRHEHLATPEVARSTFTADGRPLHSWQTALLPYIEEDALYKQIDRTKPWAHPDNAIPMGRPVKVFLHPSLQATQVNGFGTSHYAGNVAVVLGDAKTFDSFPAGISNTILAGEMSANFRAWGDPLNARDPRHGFGGPNGRPAQFVMLDGSVRTFDPKELADVLNKPLE